MKEARFLVQGSAAAPYEVHFIKDADNLSVFCSCPAGENGQYCKHRFAIMSGVSKDVVSDNANQVAEVVGWLPGTDVGEIWEQLQEAEAHPDTLKKQIPVLKKELARRMRS